MSLYVVMGVSGCGKSSVAELLAEKTGGVFLDGDNFHPAANKAKMAAAIPLTDDDRWGWLDALNGQLKARDHDPQEVFLACSALRQVYRERLAAGLSGLTFIYLHGSKDLILARLIARQHHFMSPVLLDSQFSTLEEPADALWAEIADPVEVIVQKLLPRLKNTTKTPVISHLKDK